MRECLISVIFLATLLLTPSCSRQAEEARQKGPLRQSHSVTGVVMSVDAGEKEAVVKHDPIPGYMPAMTMPFNVLDADELYGLLPGEQITFKMIVTDQEAWIEHVQKTGVAENILPAGLGIRIAREVEPLQIGDSLPDYRFLNEAGQAVHLNQFKGEALILSFIFTRCPVPNFCPLTARKLAETQNRLISNRDASANWRILAITIDPGFDTPERLKQFGKKYGYNPQHWSFLTGELIDITALAEQFGLLFWNEEGTINHKLRTVLVDSRGLIRTNMIGNQWDVDILVSEVMRAATP